MVEYYWFFLYKEDKIYRMESRRFTMSNSSFAFSNIAHEALDHISADSENDECTSQEGGVQQRSRRRLKVWWNILIIYI
jgi:hypothetical protein